MLACHHSRFTWEVVKIGNYFGAVAQLGEHLLCKQGVVGSIPISSTNTVLDSAHTEITIGPTLRLG